MTEKRITFASMYTEFTREKKVTPIDSELADMRRFLCILIAGFAENQLLVKKLECVTTVEELEELCPDDPDDPFSLQTVEKLVNYGNAMYDSADERLVARGPYTVENARFVNMQNLEQAALLMIQSGFCQEEFDDGVGIDAEPELRNRFVAHAKVCAANILKKKRYENPSSANRQEANLLRSFDVEGYSEYLTANHPGLEPLLKCNLINAAIVDAEMDVVGPGLCEAFSMGAFVDMPVFSANYLSLIRGGPVRRVLPAYVILLYYGVFASVLMRSDVAETAEEREAYVADKKKALEDAGITDYDEAELKSGRFSKAEAFKMFQDLREDCEDDLSESLGLLRGRKKKAFYEKAEEVFHYYAIGVLRVYEMFFSLMLDRYIPRSELRTLRTPVESPSKKQVSASIGPQIKATNRRFSVVRALSTTRGKKKSSTFEHKLRGCVPHPGAKAKRPVSKRVGSPTHDSLFKTIIYFISEKGDVYDKDLESAGSE